MNPPPHHNLRKKTELLNRSTLKKYVSSRHLLPVSLMVLPSIFSKTTWELERKMPLSILYFLPGSPRVAALKSVHSSSFTTT